SLAHGVEGRYPFLDHRLIEKAFSWPDAWKLSGFSQKHILRKAFAGRIPDSIIDRPKLPYQAPDLRAFFRHGEYTATVKEFLSPQRIQDYGLFDPRMVARFLKKHQIAMRERVGYRDNMLLIFLLSAQISHFWMQNPKQTQLESCKQKVHIID
ncbi:MAG: asparagine synthase-related protein, partial [Chitinivibrionales bacterium]